jgi:Tfp pilus assembly protein PilV
MPPLSSLRMRLRSQRGSLMIEVMVGALVLGLATLAVLDGLDGAQATGAKNKQRSVAATLAQQEIERLRSIPVTSLANYSSTREVKVHNVTYTVKADTDWVQDSSGVLSCTDSDDKAEYLKLKAAVTSPASERPVTETTLLTPAVGWLTGSTGTAVVKLTDRDSQPLANVSVAISSPSGSHSDTTNELGCAVFRKITPGTYRAEVHGMVSWGGEGSSTAEVPVYANKVSTTAMQLEPPASLRALFETPAGASTAWDSITLANSKLPGAAKSITAGSQVSSIDADKLFPFLDGYGVYAGTCRANNPATWKSDYFTSSGKGFALLEPGDFMKEVRVVMPRLRFTVKRSNNTAFRPRVSITQNDPSKGNCTSRMFFEDRTTGTTATAWAYEVTVPFGTYTVCADDHTRRTTTSVPLTPSAPLGIDRDLGQLTVPTNGGNGSCS